jgi:hypothetical protein
MIEMVAVTIGGDLTEPLNEVMKHYHVGKFPIGYHDNEKA